MGLVCCPPPRCVCYGDTLRDVSRYGDPHCNVSGMALPFSDVSSIYCDPHADESGIVPLPRSVWYGVPTLMSLVWCTSP